MEYLDINNMGVYAGACVCVFQLLNFNHSYQQLIYIAILLCDEDVCFISRELAC